MGSIVRQYGISFKVLASAQDTLQVVYEYDHDVEVASEHQAQEVITGAWAAGLPRRRQRLGTTGLFAFEFDVKQHEKIRTKFYVTVDYRKPEQLGPAMAAVADLHPQYHPVKNKIGYIERDKVITKAKNRTALTGGAARAADTEGSITNGAGVVAENVPVEIQLVPILISKKNITSLGPVLAMNQDREESDDGWMGTTNSDTVTIEGKTYAPRTLKFAGVFPSEQMEFDGIPYWEAERRVEIHKTTDWIIDSVGTQYVDAEGHKVGIVQYDADGNGTTKEVTEPVPIATDGLPAPPGASIQLGYYYLEAVPYGPMLGV